MINPFEGKVAITKFTTGFEVKLIYLPNNLLKFIALTDTFTAKGYSETVDAKIQHIENEIYSIAWVELTGFQVVQTIKLSENWVYSVMSANNDEAYGKRSLHSGIGEYKFTEEKADDYN